MRRHLLPLLAALIAAAATAALASAGDRGDDRGEAHEHGAARHVVGFWGDLPYSPEQTSAGVPNLIADMNGERLAFSAHVGDIKSGSSRCDDPVYDQQKAFFNSLEAPAVYTPGDNEWTDCDRANNGAYSSRERLEHIRATFFDTRSTLGQRRMRQAVQAAPYVENRRWHVSGVTYATLHVVGSDNNRPEDPEEFAARDAATNAWLRETFAEARRTGSAAGCS